MTERMVSLLREATRRVAVVAAVAGLLLATGGCGADGGSDRDQLGGAGAELASLDSPLASCQHLATPPASAAPEHLPGPDGDPLPELELPCFTGGEPVALASLRGPAVVNLWASWCAPCREELPELQRYADRTAGRVHVLGVVTDDPRPAAAAALAADLGVRFPALFDPERRLMVELGAPGVPATALVDSAGRVRYLHVEPGLDEPELARLVREQLGVMAG